MQSQDKKLQEIKDNNKFIFNELFGMERLFGKKAKKGDFGNLSDSGDIYSDDIIKINPDWSILFKHTGSIIKEPRPGYSSFERLDWNKNELKWMSNARFVVDAVEMSKGRVYRFVRGRWDEGVFEGDFFIGSHFIDGYFNGKHFVNSSWHPSPHNFIDGATDEKGTILGLNNLDSLNQNKFKFNVISINPKRKLSIFLESGVVHEITVIKRLDSTDSSFQYHVKNGKNKEEFMLPIKWNGSELRGNKVEDFNQNTLFSNTEIPLLFTKTFGLDFSSPISKVIIGEDISKNKKTIISPEQEVEKTPEELASTQESYDLYKANFIGIKSLPSKDDEYYNEQGIRVKNNIGRVFFYLPTSEYLKYFNNVVINLNNKVLQSDFAQLKSLLNNGILDGAPVGYPFLSNLIGVNTKTNPLDENFTGSLNRMESFLKHFVDRIVKYAGKANRKKGQTNIENKAVKDQIKVNLKSLLGVDDSTTTTANPTTEVPTAPVTPAPKSKKLKVAESKIEFKDVILEIIKNNLKHF